MPRSICILLAISLAMIIHISCSGPLIGDQRLDRLQQRVEEYTDSVAEAAVSNADSTEINRYIDGYKEDPELFEQWISDVRSDSLQAIETVSRRLKAIYVIDTILGHEASADEAIAYALNQSGKEWNYSLGSDQSSNAIIMMERRINRIIEAKEHLKMCHHIKSLGLTTGRKDQGVND